MAGTDLALQERQALAVSNRPDYLPALTPDSIINQIEQRGDLLPILSLDNNKFTLTEAGAAIKTFKEDELLMYFLYIHFTPQRRAFEGEYDEDNPTDPICMSNDGIAPLENVIEIQSKDGTCKNCWRSQKDTARSDKCSYLRNSIILIEYEEGDSTVHVLARLRLNANTLYGEEDRTTGEFNAESVVREFKRLNSELYYHPVIAFFDTASKNARNKLLFEIQYTEYPSEELFTHIVEQAAQNDYAEMTALKVIDNSDESDEEGSDPPEKAPRQRAAKTAGSSASKKKASRSKRGTKADKGGDDSEGSDTPTRSRRAGKKAPDAGGDAAAESDDGGAAADSGSGDGAVESDDGGAANPLEDDAVADLIGGVELP